MKDKYIWGLDLSLACTGIAIYDLEEKKFVEVDHCLTTKIRKSPIEYGDLMAYKLFEITKFIKKYYLKYPPSAVAIERLFIPKQNLLSAEINYRVHGIVNCLLYQVPQYYFPPTTIKARVQAGNAPKNVIKFSLLHNFPELQSLVTHTNYGTRKNPKWTDEDETDACGACLVLLQDEELIEYQKPLLSTIVSYIKEEEKQDKAILKGSGK